MLGMKPIIVLLSLLLSFNAHALDIVQVDGGLDTGKIFNFGNLEIYSPREITAERAYPQLNKSLYHHVLRAIDDYYVARMAEKQAEQKRLRDHGALMAKALGDQVTSDRMTNVKAEQIPWLTNLQLNAGIREAARMNPKVITISVEGYGYSGDEEHAVRSATSKGILVLASSGNVYKKWKSFPANYDLPCLVSVSATEGGLVPDYANEGEVYIANGKDEHGTSFSTARAGAIALQHMRTNPKESCSAVKQWMVKRFPRP